MGEDELSWRFAEIVVEFKRLRAEVARLREVEAAYDRLHADIKAGVVYLLPAETVERLQGRKQPRRRVVRGAGKREG